MNWLRGLIIATSLVLQRHFPTPDNEVDKLEWEQKKELPDEWETLMSMYQAQQGTPEETYASWVLGSQDFEAKRLRDEAFLAKHIRHQKTADVSDSKAWWKREKKLDIADVEVVGDDVGWLLDWSPDEGALMRDKK